MICEDVFPCAGSLAMVGLGGAEARALPPPLGGAAGGGGGGGAARARGPVTAVAARLATARGTPLAPGRTHDWLALTPKDRLPTPDHVAFPKPPKAPGTYSNIYTPLVQIIRIFVGRLTWDSASLVPLNTSHTHHKQFRLAKNMCTRHLNVSQLDVLSYILYIIDLTDHHFYKYFYY